MATSDQGERIVKTTSINKDIRKAINKEVLGYTIKLGILEDSVSKVYKKEMELL